MLNIHNMTHEEAKSWSFMSPYPVLFGNDGGCYWNGFLTHRLVAMTIASARFLHIAPTPQQKNELLRATRKLFDVMESQGIQFDFDTNLDQFKFGEDGYFATAHKYIFGTGVFDKLDDWAKEPNLCVLHFLKGTS